MTYLAKQRRSTRDRKRGALAGLAEELGIPGRAGLTSSEVACLNQANARPDVQALDARVASMARTWNPTGFFTPDELTQIVIENNKLMRSAADIVRAAPLSTSDAQFSRNQALDTIQQKTLQSLNYNNAVIEARGKGIRSINAPGVKQWVISSMNAASQAIVTAGVLECNMSWLASAIIAFQKVFDAVAAIIKRIVGVIVKLGEVALDVVEETPRLVKTLWTLAKWGGIAYGAFLLVKTIKEHRGG